MNRERTCGVLSPRFLFLCPSRFPSIKTILARLAWNFTSHSFFSTLRVQYLAPMKVSTSVLCLVLSLSTTALAAGVLATPPVFSVVEPSAAGEAFLRFPSARTMLIKSFVAVDPSTSDVPSSVPPTTAV